MFICYDYILIKKKTQRYWSCNSSSSFRSALAVTIIIGVRYNQAFVKTASSPGISCVPGDSQRTDRGTRGKSCYLFKKASYEQRRPRRKGRLYPNHDTCTGCFHGSRVNKDLQCDLAALADEVRRKSTLPEAPGVFQEKVPSQVCLRAEGVNCNEAKFA